MFGSTNIGWVSTSARTASLSHSSKSSSLISRAIVLKDKEFDQLEAPFPYVQTSSNENRTPVHVGKLNKKLHSYYKLIQN